MLRFVALSVILLASQPAPAPPAKAAMQYKTAAPMTVPAYKFAKLHLDGTTPPVNWIVLTIQADSAGKPQFTPVEWFPYPSAADCVFTGPPGQYLAISTSGANVQTQQSVTIQPPGNQPAPTPPGPVPIPPAPDPGGFIYPPGTPTTSAADDLGEVIRTSLAGTDPAKAQAFASLYAFAATKIEMDGLRQPPALKTISAATALMKQEETALMGSTPLGSLKIAYPEIGRAAAAKFNEVMQPWLASDSLAPKSRAAYVAFLRSMADGFRRATN